MFDTKGSDCPRRKEVNVKLQTSKVQYFMTSSNSFIKIRHIVLKHEYNIICY